MLCKRPREAHDGIVLDFRDGPAYLLGHYPGSTSLIPPLHRVRFAELPSVSECPPMTVIANDSDLVETVALLASAGYTSLTRTVAASSVDWRDETMERGPASRRLWLPSPTLLTMALPPGHAVDFGCGAGRDSVHLASLGWRVTAFDNQKAFINKLTALATREGVMNRIDAVLFDLSSNGEVEPSDSAWKTANLYVFSRFFSPAWMQRVAKISKEGAIVAVHHFCEGAVNRVGTPMPVGHVVSEAVLGEIFKRWTVVTSERCVLPDGRPVLNFVARK